MVAGVQEGTWPDLRLRGSLLGVDELSEAVHLSSRAGRPDQWPGSGLGADVDAAMLAAKLLAEERNCLRCGHPGPAAARGHRGGRRGH